MSDPNREKLIYQTLCKTCELQGLISVARDTLDELLQFGVSDSPESRQQILRIQNGLAPLMKIIERRAIRVNEAMNEIEVRKCRN